MKKLIRINYFLVTLIGSILLGRAAFSLLKQPDEKELESFRKVSKYVNENERCFKCHDKQTTKATDTLSKAVIEPQDTLKLKESQIIRREIYYQSNHRSMACIGCHTNEDPESKDPASEPTAESRTCTDCHLLMNKHQFYQFAAIEEEYSQSIHHQRKPEDFTCWKCHNPHTDKIHIRNAENLREAIAYDNSICLSCHKNTDSSEMHQWLPEPEKHMGNVRCIDCHTKENENILVAHLVSSKEKSVRKCSECHFSNSLLLTTLYKNRTANTESQNGLFNAKVIQDAFIIGGNRSKFLNMISLIIFGLAFSGILLHMIPRIIKKNKD
jgi:hypothetical protein